MDPMYSWFAQPLGVKGILLILFAVVLTSAVRFWRLARCLYRHPGERVPPESILSGGADPDLLAASALSSRIGRETLAANRASFGAPVERPNVEAALGSLRMAEGKFLYLWEKCHMDVESTRRASLLTLLVTIVMVTYGAFPTYYGWFNNSNLPGSYCLLTAAKQLFGLLAFGISACGMLYGVSSFFERTLADRKACWTYFCWRLRNELSRE